MVFSFNIPSQQMMELVCQFQTQKPIIQYDYIPIMQLSESFTRHSNSALPFFIPGLDERDVKLHQIKTSIFLEYIDRQRKEQHDPRYSEHHHNTENILRNLKNLNASSNFPDLSQMSTEELLLNQETSLSYFQRGTIDALLFLEILRVTDDFTLLFNAELTPEYNDLLKKLGQTGLKYTIEEIITKIANKKGIRVKRKQIKCMVQLIGFVYVYGRNGCIWKF
jgi:hypothetical protein